MRGKRRILSASAMRGLLDAMDRYRSEYEGDRDAFTKEQAADMANAARWLQATMLDRGGIYAIRRIANRKPATLRIVKGRG